MFLGSNHVLGGHRLPPITNQALHFQGTDTSLSLLVRMLTQCNLTVYRLFVPLLGCMLPRKVAEWHCFTTYNSGTPTSHRRNASVWCVNYGTCALSAPSHLVQGSVGRLHTKQQWYLRFPEKNDYMKPLCTNFRHCFRNATTTWEVTISEAWSYLCRVSPCDSPCTSRGKQLPFH